jgi:hypothetical protein
LSEDEIRDDYGIRIAQDSRKSGFDLLNDRLRKHRRLKLFLPYLLIAILFSGLTFGVEASVSAKQISSLEDTLILHGGKQIDETTLRDIILSKKLTVYWLSPKPGAQYLIDTSVPNAISLHVTIPADPKIANSVPSIYDIGTFASPNAFALTRKASLSVNGMGFVNIDGNAIYYDSRSPTNIYIGLKGLDIQVQLYDPRPDQALSAVMAQGNLQQIK